MSTQDQVKVKVEADNEANKQVQAEVEQTQESSDDDDNDDNNMSEHSDSSDDDNDDDNESSSTSSLPSPASKPERKSVAVTSDGASLAAASSSSSSSSSAVKTSTIAAAVADSKQPATKANLKLYQAGFERLQRVERMITSAPDGIINWFLASSRERFTELDLQRITGHKLVDLAITQAADTNEGSKQKLAADFLAKYASQEELEKIQYDVVGQRALLTKKYLLAKKGANKSEKKTSVKKSKSSTKNDAKLAAESTGDVDTDKSVVTVTGDSKSSLASTSLVAEIEVKTEAKANDNDNDSKPEKASRTKPKKNSICELAFDIISKIISGHFAQYANDAPAHECGTQEFKDAVDAQKKGLEVLRKYMDNKKKKGTGAAENKAKLAEVDKADKAEKASKKNKRKAPADSDAEEDSSKKGRTDSS